MSGVDHAVLFSELLDVPQEIYMLFNMPSGSVVHLEKARQSNTDDDASYTCNENGNNIYLPHKRSVSPIEEKSVIS